MIPYALTYTSTTRGRVPKFVDCEECGQKYVYFLERSASGEGTSFLFLENAEAQQRAEETAKADLTAELARGVDPVPCPRCGWFQKSMVKRARDLHRKWMITAGIVCLIAAIPLFIAGAIANGQVAQGRWRADAQVVAYVAGVLTAGCVLLAPTLLIGRAVSVARFDPNAAPAADRIEDGRDRALTLVEYEAILARQQAADGN
jgi:hypothetical protein